MRVPWCQPWHGKMEFKCHLHFSFSHDIEKQIWILLFVFRFRLTLKNGFELRISFFVFASLWKTDLNFIFRFSFSHHFEKRIWISFLHCACYWKTDWSFVFLFFFQSNAKTKNEKQNSYPFFKVMRKRKTKYEVQNRFSKLGENEKQKAKFKFVFQCHAKTKNGNGTWIPFSHAIEKRLALRYTHSEFLFLPKPSNVIINYSQSNGKTSLQENHPQNRVIYLFSSLQITPPQKPTICCANLTAFPYCFTNQAQVFQIVWAGKMYKLIFSIIKSSRGHIMNPSFGQDGWILGSFFLAFLVTSNFSRSKIKRAWPMPNNLDFTFDQKPLFLFFPSSSSLPFFFSFWQRCLKSGSIYPVCWECTSSWAVG